MFTTRRRFTGWLSGSLAAGGLFHAVPALARGGDDDGPPNVFFSPHGRPYRAPPGAPYPVVDWFKDADRNGDGKVAIDEFLADAAAFFDVLDLKGQGVLGASEIAVYEQKIAPEVLGMRVTVYASERGAGQPRLWLAQFGPGQGGPQEGPVLGHGNDGPSTMPNQPGSGGPDDNGVLPPDVKPNNPSQPDPNALLTGAAPYSLTGEPEPVTAADPDYLLLGVVKKAPFLAHARDNFALLDQAGAGYLTLDGLPLSPVEKMLGHGRRRAERG